MTCANELPATMLLNANMPPVETTGSTKGPQIGTQITDRMKRAAPVFSLVKIFVALNRSYKTAQLTHHVPLTNILCYLTEREI